MTVGKAGVPAEMIRSCKGYGFDPWPPRTYSRAVRGRRWEAHGFIKRAQELGFGLDDVQEMLNLCVQGVMSCRPGGLDLREGPTTTLKDLGGLASGGGARVTSRVLHWPKYRSGMSETYSRP